MLTEAGERRLTSPFPVGRSPARLPAGREKAAWVTMPGHQPSQPPGGLVCRVLAVFEVQGCTSGVCTVRAGQPAREARDHEAGYVLN